MRRRAAFGRYEKKMAELVKVPLLIIDDFGLRPMRSPQDEDFHDLISERYERATTIVTSKDRARNNFLFLEYL